MTDPAAGPVDPKQPATTPQPATKPAIPAPPYVPPEPIENIMESEWDDPNTDSQRI
jgi:hypothetical protein